MTAFPKSASHENRLARETSPYLLQHKHNPVDWWPWGPEALAEAQRSGRPILLSIGYAACHWCHVMAHESFEDPATAAVMNELFVNIKVDREERPDIDQIYMSALHMLGQQGGWPLTMILTPAGEPFWGGTYFPNVSRYGRPSFVDVLREIARIFHEEPGRVEHNRAALMARLAESAGTEGRVAFGIPELDRIAGQLAGAIDLAHGGLQGAPKFPQCAMLEFLWRAGMRALHRTPAETGGSRASGGSGGFAPPEPFSENSEATLFSMMRRKNEYLDLFALSMERMSEGGIYDHLGGGFARYSVDERWLVPHFEKMLYDNAQLLELLALAHVHSGHPLFSARAIETVGWLEREMTTPEGAFCASLDADSEGEEGRFYVWSMAELDRALGAEDAAVFAAHYDATATGNFEGHTILNRLQRLDEFRNAQSGRAYSPAPLDPDAESQLAPLRHRLLAARSLRARPGLDDKVLADWNGLMIAALVNAGLSLDRPGWIALARRAFDFIARAMTRDDRFGHSWREGRLLFPGLASDFAAMIRAALALFEATAERPFLDQAIAWQSALERHYADPETGGYFLTADDAEALIVRPASTHDDAIPNPNGLAAQNLVRLAILAGDDRWRDRADQVFDGLLPIAARNLFGHLSLLNALDMRLRAAEVVIGRSCAHNDPLIVAAQHLPFTERILLRTVSEDGLPPSHPVRAKLAAAPTGATAAFVCVGDRCSLPVTTPAQLRALVAGDTV